MHVSIDADHVFPASRSACLASGCHDSGATTPFQGKSVAAIHSAASTVTPSGTRASCQICHAPGVTPTTDCLASGCHPDRANPHGYDPAKHLSTVTTATITILGTPFPNQVCADCHKLELGPLHMPPATCQTCHASLVPIAGGWNKGCVQAGCHPVGSALEMHASVDASHSIPAYSCNATGCHAGAGNLAAIHSTATTVTPSGTLKSCQVCHAAGRTPSATCSDCHNMASPHRDMTEAHTSSGGTDFVSVGMNDSTHNYGDGVDANCSECHVTNLLTLHSNNCATCHDPSVRPDVRAAIMSHDTNCTTCHPSHHVGDIFVHYSVAGDNCRSCHNEDPNSGNSANVTCTGCHNP
jgi:hypothetical protein